MNLDSDVWTSGMAVAGDLVFFGDSTGLFHAADAKTGEILWTFDALTVPKIGDLAAAGDPAPLFGLDVEPAPKDAKKHILSISEGGVTLPDRENYGSNSRYIVKRYRSRRAAEGVSR